MIVLIEVMFDVGMILKMFLGLEIFVIFLVVFCLKFVGKCFGDI